MDKTTNPSMAASFWGPTASLAERFGVAPISALQGTAVPSADYPTAGLSGIGSGTDQLTGHSAPTLAAVRMDDARVPEPRGRQR